VKEISNSLFSIHHSRKTHATYIQRTAKLAHDNYKIMFTLTEGMK